MHESINVYWKQFCALGHIHKYALDINAAVLALLLQAGVLYVHLSAS